MKHTFGVGEYELNFEFVIALKVFTNFFNEQGFDYHTHRIIN